MNPHPIQIATSDDDSVSALLYLAEKKNRAAVTVILGHGAGANQLHPFMRLFAAGLAERGVDVLTFNFQYMEQGRKVPDPKAKLESCYRAVIEAARTNKKLKGNRLVIGGKSMGGRIASQVAATLDCGGSTPLSDVASRSGGKSKSQKAIRSHSGSTTSQATSAPAEGGDDNTANRNPIEIAALIFLGYPLHPPGRPDKLRDAHLPQIKAPMLFVQGSRDAFGSPDELRATIKKHHLSATLQVVVGGDHSLKIPKAFGIPQREVDASTMDKTAAWLKAP